MEIIKEFNDTIDDILIGNQKLEIEFDYDIDFADENINDIKKLFENLDLLMNASNVEHSIFGYSSLINFIKDKEYNFKIYLLHLKYSSLYGIIILNSNHLIKNNVKLLNLKKSSEKTLLNMKFNTKFNFLVAEKDEFIKDPSLANFQVFDLVKDIFNPTDYFLILFFNFLENKIPKIINKKKYIGNPNISKNNNSERNNISNDSRKKKIIFNNLKINKINKIKVKKTSDTKFKFNSSLKSKGIKTSKVTTKNSSKIGIKNSIFNKYSITSRLFKKPIKKKI